MQIREIMSGDIEIIDPTVSLRDAARKMKKLDCGALPVGENDRLIGMITDRDITVRAVAQGKNPASTKVRDAMSERIKYIYEDQDIRDAAKKMEAEKIRRLVVLNRNKRAVGICSLGDIATHTHDGVSAEILEKVSLPS